MKTHTPNRAAALFDRLGKVKLAKASMGLQPLLAECQAVAHESMNCTAPDLLTTLEEIEAQLAEHPDVARGNSKIHFCYQQARAAIQKAKGL